MSGSHEPPLLDPRSALGAVLAAEIPLVGHLGLRIAGETDGGLALHAPLEGNSNHQRTAFAGSLNAVATLAGWGTVWLLLHRGGLRGQVVIQDSRTEYFAPVHAGFTATCLPPDPRAVERFLAMVARHGRGRLGLTVAITADGAGEPAVRFAGRYVVVPPGAPA